MNGVRNVTKLVVTNQMSAIMYGTPMMARIQITSIIVSVAARDGG